MTATRDTAPFIVVGTTPTFTPDALGTAVQIPSSALTNPFNVPIEVRGLRFTQVSGSSTPFRALEASLRAGRHDLTNGFCPIYGVGPQYDDMEETRVGLPGLAFDFVTTVYWLFPKPMILPAGASIAGSVRGSPGAFNTVTGGSVPAAAVSVTIAALCRRLPVGAPTVRTTCIPYVNGTYYFATSAAGPLGGPAANDLQLMNTFQVPLRVTRIVIANMGGSGLGGQLNGTLATAMTITGPGGVVGTPRRTVAQGSGDGLSAQRRAIEVAHDLRPGESYKVTTETGSAFGMVVAISGYREEAL